MDIIKEKSMSRIEDSSAKKTMMDRWQQVRDMTENLTKDVKSVGRLGVHKVEKLDKAAKKFSTIAKRFKS